MPSRVLLRRGDGLLEPMLVASHQVDQPRIRLSSPRHGYVLHRIFRRASWLADEWGVVLAPIFVEEGSVAETADAGPRKGFWFDMRRATSIHVGPQKAEAAPSR